MDPISIAMLAMGAGQAAMGVGQQISAGIQRRRARREFDEYQIPASAKASLDQAKSIASLRGVPGEDIYRSQAQAAAAGGIEAAQRTAQSPTDVLSVLGRVYSGLSQFEGNMAIQGASAYERRQAQLASTLDRFSRLETERWQYNELYPYLQAMGAAGQTAQAGSANISGGMNMALGTLGGMQDVASQKEMFQSETDRRIKEMNAMRDMYQGMGRYPAGPVPQPGDPFDYVGPMNWGGNFG